MGVTVRGMNDEGHFRSTRPYAILLAFLLVLPSLFSQELGKEAPPQAKDPRSFRGA
ncbi:hypothetical protein MASR2M78_36110 [Treponema sp.]